MYELEIGITAAPHLRNGSLFEALQKKARKYAVARTDLDKVSYRLAVCFRAIDSLSWCVVWQGYD
jgi:hypothetical protein